MAKPIAFEPKWDPKKELARKLDSAPLDHAEALLELYALLDEAYEQGLLDLAHGAIGNRQAILSKVAEALCHPASTQAMRNLIVLGKLLGSLDPAGLSEAEEAVAAQKNAKPPSLWSLMKSALSEDGRRGLATGVTLLVGLGKASAGKK